MSKVYQYINYVLQGPNVVKESETEKWEGADRRREEERSIMELFREG